MSKNEKLPETQAKATFSHTFVNDRTKATILTYFYPEVTVEKMSSYRKKH